MNANPRTEFFDGIAEKWDGWEDLDALARKLATRYNCRMTKAEHAMFCKQCGMPRLVGKNTTVRLRKRTRIAEYLCSCGAKAGFKY